MRYVSINLLLIVVMLVGLYSCNRVSKEDQEAAAAIVDENMGDQAPDFTLTNLEGDTMSLESMRGKFVVIHFATTWCPFCNAEAPYLEELYQKEKDNGVVVLIIDVLEDKDLVTKKLRDRFDLSFPILMDYDGAVSTRYAPPDALPDLARDEVMLASNLIIDPEGKIRFMTLLDSQNFDAKLTDLKEKLEELMKDYTPPATSSVDFVKFKNALPAQVKAGAEGAVTLTFEVKEGYHIQANKVNDESLIPASIEMDVVEGIDIQELQYPAWKEFQMKGTTQMLWVFDGEFHVHIPFKIHPEQPTGQYMLSGNLYYQACDHRKCYFPRHLPFEMQVQVG